VRTATAGRRITSILATIKLCVMLAAGAVVAAAAAVAAVAGRLC
jgi:hypothetical protein